MNKHLVWLVPLALAGCKKNDVDMKNASVAEVAQKVQQSGVAKTSLKPGMWQATVKIESVSAPGAPPEVQKGMRGTVGQSHAISECLTDEQAKKPFEHFVDGINKECKYEHFSMGDGKIDTKLVCSMQGQTREMTMKGTYDPEHYNMSMITSASGGLVKQVDMTMSMEAHRTGECPAKKAG